MTRPLGRRAAIIEMGKAGLAVVVLGAAACGDEGVGGTRGEGPTTHGGVTTTSPAASSATSGEDPGALTTVTRVDLDFVSAYILARGGEAALVDTGVAGSEAATEAALGAAGLEWGSVGHVILTHRHPDHVGSLPGVLTRAPAATVYAGEADLPFITSPVPARPVGDGDRVFDLDVIATPGHTLGHVSVHDPGSGILVAGDALNGAGSGMPAPGGVAGANPEFSEDMALADDSVRKLATLGFEMVYFGHGEPLLEGGAAAVAALASTLG